MVVINSWQGDIQNIISMAIHHLGWVRNVCMLGKLAL